MSQSTLQIDGIIMLKSHFSPVSLQELVERQTNRHESKSLSQF